MKHYAGLDVSIKETSICIVDEDGRICRELKAISHPEDISRSLNGVGVRLEKVGLEAGPLGRCDHPGVEVLAHRLTVEPELAGDGRDRQTLPL